MSMIVALALTSALSSARAGSMPERRAQMLVPKTDHEALRSRIYAAFPRSEGRWGAVHVVDRTCSLSRAVIAHLIERRASADLDELVIVIGSGATTREDVDLVHAGFRVRVVSRERAIDVVPIATPVMIVARPDGTLAYVGGHRRDVSGFFDATIASDLVATGVTEVSLPVVGCVGSEPFTSRAR
jgi:hypothetical protein